MSKQSQQDDYKTFIHYLPDVKTYISELELQDIWWSTVGMVGKINNENIDSQLLESIVETQKEFQNLRDIMINELVSRYINQANSEIMLKAQTTIDILIRNLFERTADVGFLATDDDLVEFMANKENDEEQSNFIFQRIQEYVAKYSVYDDILLVEPSGNVKAKLDQSNSVQHSTDPLIREALITDKDYIEVFRHSDLFPNKTKSLIYAKKMVRQTQPGQYENVGVLCLSFNFDQEMEGIFATLNKGSDSNLMLLNDTGEVIASSNQKQFPLTKQLKTPDNTTQTGQSGNSMFFSAKTMGYQDFYGLPWYGHIDIERDVAFKKNRNQRVLNIEIPKDSPLYLKDLEQINLRVSTMLLTVILNGKIMSLKRDVKSFLPILDRFHEISIEIQSIFARFIQHIHQVLLDTIQSKVAFSAALAVEVMDRNLYERANDCRWWALNSQFRQILTDHNTTDVLNPKQTQTLTEILTYINNLYTVYTNLIIYDQDGTILAVSNPEEAGLINTVIPRKADTSRCLGLNDTQAYVVSDFHLSELYHDEHTYIYHAAIKSWHNDNENVGGIAIVFDSKPEFKAMLKETEPKYSNDAINKTTFSLFIDRNGSIISSTNEDILVGENLALPNEILTAENGENDTIDWVWNSTKYLIGYKVSEGYREYKNGDGYENDVIALVFTGL